MLVGYNSLMDHFLEINGDRSTQDFHILGSLA